MDISPLAYKRVNSFARSFLEIKEKNKRKTTQAVKITPHIN